MVAVDGFPHRPFSSGIDVRDLTRTLLETWFDSTTLAPVAASAVPRLGGWSTNE